MESKWISQWGSKDIVFSHGSSASKGVAILITKNINYSIEKKIIDENGRFILIDLCINERTYTIINFYAPTRNFQKEQIDVFAELTLSLETFSKENIILGADMNVYMNPSIDKLDSMPDTGDNPEYRSTINAFLDTFSMVDVWRILNPCKRVFTFHRGNARSRLDYFFASEHLLNNLISAEILPGFHSDHSLICLMFDNNDIKTGKGFWKFNSSLLYDSEYVHSIKSIIAECSIKYKYIEDKRVTWELVKMDIRNFTVPFCINKKKKDQVHENLLYKRHAELFELIQTNINDKDIETEYKNINTEIEQIERHKARGIILRSKCRWTEEGEHNTSYFLRLEKNNFCNKLISQLDLNGVIVKDPNEILEAEKNFYNDLYRKPNTNEELLDINTKIFTNNKTIPQLSEIDKEFCDAEISETEILASIKQLKNGKSPGSDGLTAEFYKFFWVDIKTLLTDSLKYSLLEGELSVEQKRGIITLIPKKEKNRLFLKNWRPISLLNVDYKILAKLFAIRLTKVLPFIINEDQTGYIKGRFIGFNIRQIEDAILFSDINNTPGIILSIDFEKAFDTINWKFIDSALRAFNFGENFCNVIKTLYNNISSCVTNGGQISDWFMPERGVRQGCPISPYLFIIAIELLAIHIRENEDIQGIEINNKVLKICQLADDTTCFVKDLESINIILSVFNKFKVCAGLKMNIDKTKANYIGSLKNSVDSPLGLDWSEPYISCLGIIISGNEDDHYNLNYKKKIMNLKSLFNSWKCRKLSLKGKITVINNLGLPPLLYICSVIHTPQKVINEVKNIVLDFLWDSKPSKIAYDVMIQNISDGGLKLMDIDSKIKSIKAIWGKRFILDGGARWKAAPGLFYNTNDISSFFKFNQNKRHIVQKFYNEVYNHWSEVRKLSTPLKLENVKGQIIWNNRYINISKKPVYWKQWADKGIMMIQDLITDKGTFMNETELRNVYGINCSFLNVLQIRDSIPKEWKDILYSQKYTGRKLDYCKDLYICNKMYNIEIMKTNVIYNHFIKSKCRTPTCIVKWTEVYPEFNNASEDLWPNIFILPFRITRETRLQTFQFKIIHRLITCQKKLHEMKIVENNLCLYCHDIDDLKHFFLYCEKSHQFWNSFFNWWNTLGDITISPDYESLEECIVFGFQSKGEIFDVINYCILLGKYYIYCQKIHKNNAIDFYEYLIQLRYKLRIERNICNQNSNNRFDKFIFLYDQL